MLSCTFCWVQVVKVNEYQGVLLSPVCIIKKKSVKNSKEKIICKFYVENVPF